MKPLRETGVSGKSLSLKDALILYKQDYLPSRNYAQRTRVEYINDLNQLARFFAKSKIFNLNQVSRKNLERFLAYLDQKGYAGQTRRRKTASIHSLFSFLYHDGYSSINISFGLIPPRAESKEPRVLSEEEYKVLLRTCSYSARDTAIIELFLQTGIRLSELVNLKLQDISLPARIGKQPENIGMMKIKGGKGRKDRTLPLNYKVCRALKAYLKIRPEIEGKSIFINKFGRPLGPRGVQIMVKKHMQECGIEGATVHSLRHTFGTHHIAKGTSLRSVQEALGHTDLKTTSIYISLSRTMMNKELQENAL
ncbi:MAG: tyrosine-type recombinase/integrase [Anaerolineales bacterium]